MAGLNVPQRGRHQYLSSKETGLLAGKTASEASEKEVLICGSQSEADRTTEAGFPSGGGGDVRAE